MIDKHKNTQVQRKGIALEITSAVIAALSLVTVIAIEMPFAKTPFSFGITWLPVLIAIDTLACVFFWFEFAWGYSSAADRKKYTAANVINLLGAIPMVGFLRWLRIIRLVRVFRFTRLGWTILKLWHYWHLSLARSPLQSLSVSAVVLLVLGGSCFYLAEAGTNDQISNLVDAIWWSAATATTVGYGDIYPVTIGGRLVSLAVFIVGIGLMGSFTAALAAAIVREPDPEGADLTDILEKLNRIDQRIDDLASNKPS